MKKRLDVYLVENAIAGGRDSAKRLIGQGKIFVDGKAALKPSMDVENRSVELRGEGLRYVSRGGLKLEKALTAFKIDLNGKVGVDVGASTGGFTDCMLQNGAKRVYAVDVGTNQLADSLLKDERVVSMENTDIRSLTLDERADFACVDVAFISLTLVLPAVKNLLREGGGLVALIKPQFEAGRGKVGKRGIVRNKAVRREVVERITAFAQSIGLCVAGLDYSPVKGSDGNSEYLLYALRRPPDEASARIVALAGEMAERG